MLFFSFLFNFILSFLHLLTCVYIIWAISPHPPFHLMAHRFCRLVLWFCWRKNIKDKKNIAFLLVWDEDSYTGRFFVLFPCICVLQPKLVHSSLLPGPLSIVASASLRLLYSLLYSEHINQVQILGFFPSPYSSSAHSPFSVWPMSIIITAFLLAIWGRTCDFWPSEPD
jgi:hypothetical protein